MTEVCLGVAYDQSKTDKDVKLSLYVANQTYISEKIKAETATPQPLVILEDGSTVNLSTMSLKMT